MVLVVIFRLFKKKNCFVDTCDLVHDNVAILKAYGIIFWNMIYALETAISSLTGITHKWFPDAVSS